MANLGTGIFVTVRNNDLDAAIRVFSRKVKEEKIIIQIKERQYYEKKSVKRKRKKAAAISRQRRESTENKQF